MTGEVKAYFGIGATRGATGGQGGNYAAGAEGSGYGMIGYKGQSLTGATHPVHGLGSGGGGEPAGGGARGTGSPGGIYIREYR